MVIFSSGFLLLLPMLCAGLKLSHHAESHRMAAHVAQGLIERAQQGETLAHESYFNDQGRMCAEPSALYCVQTTISTVSSTLQKYSLRVIPVGAPDQVVTYVVWVAKP